MNLDKIAKPIFESGPLKQEDSPRRIRVLLDGVYIFDTTSARLVWEHPYYPQYYFQLSELQNATLSPAGESKHGAFLNDIQVGKTKREKAAINFSDGKMSGFVRLDFDAMDAWFEEDEPIRTHPLDPYKRIDIRQSSRKIAVEVDGVRVAESEWSKHLYETGLPVRYYLPQTAVKWEYLRPSETRSGCPYKGTARYFDIVINGEVKKDLVWYYPETEPGTAAMLNLLCFYNEKVDISLDGKKLERPQTKWS